MTMLHRLTAALVIWGAAASMAQAQYFLKPLNDYGLGRAEQKLMGAAAQKLYSPVVQAEGATESWTSPNGAQGSVTLERVETRADGAVCVVLRHTITSERVTEPQTVGSRRCRQPNGTWLYSDR